MQKLARHLVTHLVDHPKRVQVLVDAQPNELRQSLTIKVHPDDVRLVVGRRGRTIRAIRALMGSAASFSGLTTRVAVEAADLGQPPNLSQSPNGPSPVEPAADALPAGGLSDQRRRRPADDGRQTTDG
ncbi:MAG: KH domain-containing protein [Deltaproteobacteria bacterium]|jgi:predicted RNA-binding protein YlqC (UPF0109 family)|nr:KH domain-containing protein [Deltaproteobacteria bacterium]